MPSRSPLSLCRWKIFEKTGGHRFFQKLFISVYNVNALLVGKPGEARTGFVQLPLVGEAHTGGCSSYYGCCCCCCCCCYKQMWWGMNYYDNHSTRSPSPHNVKRRDAIAINSQREVVNHPRVGGQEFTLHKWKLKRRASCCYLELVSDEKCFHAAGEVLYLCFTQHFCIKSCFKTTLNL